MIIDTDELRKRLRKEEQDEIRQIERIKSEHTADACYRHAEQKWYGILAELDDLEYWAKKLLPEEVPT